MSKISDALCAIVNEKKKLRQITKYELARRVGCSSGFMSQMLNGDKRINDNMLERICNALEIKLSDLENWSPELAEIRFSGASKDQSKGVMVSGTVSGNAVVGSAIVGSNNSSVVVRNGVVRNGQENTLSDEAAELLRIYKSLDVKLRMKLLESAFSLEEQQKTH
jgi:DNA-binding Xre family transcriptional regulator